MERVWHILINLIIAALFLALTTSGSVFAQQLSADLSIELEQVSDPPYPDNSHVTYLVSLTNLGPDPLHHGARTGSQYLSYVLGDHQSECRTWSTNLGGLRSFGVDTDPIGPGETVSCLSSIEVRSGAENFFLFEIDAGAYSLVPPGQIPVDPDLSNNHAAFWISRLGPRQIPVVNNWQLAVLLAALLGTFGALAITGQRR